MLCTLKFFFQKIQSTGSMEFVTNYSYFLMFYWKIKTNNSTEANLHRNVRWFHAEKKSLKIFNQLVQPNLLQIIVSFWMFYWKIFTTNSTKANLN